MKTTTRIISIITIAIIIILWYTEILDIEFAIFLTLMYGTGVFLQYKTHTDKPKPEVRIKPGIETKVCNVCQTVNNVNRVYCRHCNTPIRNIVCPVCQHKNPYDKKYCESCDSILQNKNRY